MPAKKDVNRTQVALESQSAVSILSYAALASNKRGPDVEALIAHILTGCYGRKQIVRAVGLLDVYSDACACSDNASASLRLRAI